MRRQITILGLVFGSIALGVVPLFASQANRQVHSRQEQDEGIDQCQLVLAEYYHKYSIGNTTPITARRGPLGGAFFWRDEQSGYALLMLVPGTQIKPQPWGHGFDLQGQCVVGTLKFDVWFAKWEPQGA